MNRIIYCFLVDVAFSILHVTKDDFPGLIINIIMIIQHISTECS